MLLSASSYLALSQYTIKEILGYVSFLLQKTSILGQNDAKSQYILMKEGKLLTSLLQKKNLSMSKYEKRGKN